MQPPTLTYWRDVLALVASEEASAAGVAGDCRLVRLLYQVRTTRIEEGYLNATAAVFPSAQRAWSEQRTRSETMTVIAIRLAELDDAEPAPRDDSVAFDQRVAALVGDLVEPVRSQAYNELGDGRRAVSVAVRRLRPKLLADPG